MEETPSQQRETAIEKPQNHEILSSYTSQVFPPSIKRKPVALSTESALTSHQHTSRTTITARKSYATRIRKQWSLLQTRYRVSILVGCAALLILIIGLSAGLSTRHHKQNLPLPSSHGGPYTGDLTYYDPGLGACGVTSSSSDAIVAVSHLLFDAVSTSSNPNANPLCGKKIRAKRNGVSRDVTVVDRCVGCQARDLDVTRSVFADLASIDQGRVMVEWAWLEDVPESAAGS